MTLSVEGGEDIDITRRINSLRLHSLSVGVTKIDNLKADGGKLSVTLESGREFV